MPKNTSIVISMYNARGSTLEVVDKLLFPSLLNNGSPDKQLILLDDVSPMKHETKSMVEKYSLELRQRFGDFIFTENPVNLGFSGSYNRGMKMAEGQSVLIANDDVYFPLKSIDSLVSVLGNQQNTGAVGPVTNYAFNYQNTKLFKKLKDYSPEELQRIEDFASKLRYVMSGKTYDSESGLIDFCLVFNQETLHDVGYFDERYTYGVYEDTDLNRRILNSGRKVILDASTFVEHGGPDGGSMSINQHMLKALKCTFNNARRYAKKWNDNGVYLHTLKGVLQVNGVNTVTEEIKKEARVKGIEI